MAFAATVAVALVLFAGVESRLPPSAASLAIAPEPQSGKVHLEVPASGMEPVHRSLVRAEVDTSLVTDNSARQEQETDRPNGQHHPVDDPTVKVATTKDQVTKHRARHQVTDEKTEEEKELENREQEQEEGVGDANATDNATNGTNGTTMAMNMTSNTNTTMNATTNLSSNETTEIAKAIAAAKTTRRKATKPPELAIDTAISIGGGNWTLVRHTPPGPWHKATDRLNGSDVYGYDCVREIGVCRFDAPKAWSRKFSHVPFDEFLFATGDAKLWLIASRVSVLGNYYNNLPRTVRASSDHPLEESFENWQNRADKLEDPIISLKNFDDSVREGTVLYCGAGLTGDAAGKILPIHKGANVYIRASLITTW